MGELIFEELSYRIRGALFEVYKEKGCRFLDEHRAQIYNYLRATGFKLGLLVNFGHHPQIKIERIAN